MGYRCDSRRGTGAFGSFMLERLEKYNSQNIACRPACNNDLRDDGLARGRAPGGGARLRQAGTRATGVLQTYYYRAAAQGAAAGRGGLLGWTGGLVGATALLVLLAAAARAVVVTADLRLVAL